MIKRAQIMEMPVSVTLVDADAKEEDIEELFDYFRSIDKKFSTYKQNSEIEKINRGELETKHASEEMRYILQLCEDTRQETKGYFNININGKLDPSGLVKGYAIYQASEMLKKKGYKNFAIEIAGDAQLSGVNEENKPWQVGIQNPFNLAEIVKIVSLSNNGIATSGTYQRGYHIINPKKQKKANDIASMTIIAPNVYEADRFATAAFAMGEKGIDFIEKMPHLEGYMIAKNKQAVMTSGFDNYVATS